MMLPHEVSLWNETTKEYPLDRPMTLFLEEQASRTPDLVAVRFEGIDVTYSELNRRANRVAKYLRSCGVTTDTLVGVYMERSIEMVVALVGIMKAGGAYVPFDPEYPADRLAFMFADSAIPYVLSQRRFEGNGVPADVRAIYLDDTEWQHSVEVDNDNPPLASNPDSAAYMIYTSGSTGKPKGVINVHRGLVNRLLWMQDAYQLTHGDRVLQKTPYSFDVSVWEFFWPLMTGACIVMAKPGGHRDNAYLVDTIVRENVTTMHFVPSMLNLFVSSDGLERITSLRQVMSSGEALPFQLTKRFFDRLPHTRLHNLYGPTEAAIDVTYWECKPDASKNVVPIGFPIANTQMYILDDAMQPVPIGEEGELHIGGLGLARGYCNRPELTSERFVRDPFSTREGARLYKTGDLARYMPDGAIEYLGRLDFQVKLRGFRIELGEIEAVLLKHVGVSEAVVIASEDALEDKQLVAYVVAKADPRPSVSELRKLLQAELPEYMVPARFIFLQEMPLLPNGKVNRKALPKGQQDRPELAEMYVAPQSEMERTLCQLWSELMNLKQVGIRDNFFELGGNSLLAIRMSTELRKVIQRDMPVVRIFQYPTIEKLAAHLSDDDSGSKKLLEEAYERATRIRIGRFSGNAETDGVAVIGMVGRFPGADSIDELWNNLVNKVESITRFSLDELGPGIDDETKNDPNYVPTRGIINDADKFDAQFFGVGPLEAKVMDPQQRVFLELAWAALETAGYEPSSFPGMIGVYAGVGDNHYYPNNVLSHPDLVKTVGSMIVGYGNEKDYIATRVSYSLNLTGPSVSANTGCSTSLLSVDHAFKALIDFECDIALAGGVDIFVPQRSGQLYTEGGTFTKDGHCRPFDAEATGTMFCDGAGIVVLRRLEDAIAAGDKIYAVIRGIAKNNDGANKVSFLAPSVEGQAQVIALAQAQANVLAETISYVEAHGTGTPLGDPIEVEALTKAFRATTDKTQFCWLGSVKGNVGHPTIASGVTGFIKASLALHHEVIPATLHYAKPNPKIDFERSPFVVVSDTTPWPRTGAPRRAAVSSFGFGGTNVHAILEEAPLQQPSGPSRPKHLVLLSAKSDAALGRLRKQYAEFLTRHSDTNLADMAFTLMCGRKHLAHREFIVCSDPLQAASELNRGEGTRVPTQKLAALNPGVVFMFPGQGSQYVNMGLDLYGAEPVFRNWVNTCCDILRPHLDRDLRELLFPEPGDESTAAESLKDTYYTQPALFTIEYSLARFWMSLGLMPSALMGHSVGEFVCACISGIVTLEEILPMVALRGRLIRSLPRGSMLSVRCAASEVQKRLPPDIQLAASNSPNLSVVAGPNEAVVAFSQALEREGFLTRQLHTSHAFHSAMMDPIVGEYVDAMRRVKFSKSTIPIMSTCTADWLTDDVSSNPEYWGRHLRSPVLFSDAASKFLKDNDKVFLEVGPRDVLTTLVRQHVDLDQRERMVASLGNTSDNGAEWTALLSAIGQLWVNGVSIDWNSFYANERRRRIPLPTYPFERKSHWLEPVAKRMHGAVNESPIVRSEEAVEAGEAENPWPSASAQAVPGSDEVMTTLKVLLQETLGVKLDTRGEDTPFIALGADSLLLMQLGRVVQARFGLAVSFRQLVEQYATPNLLASAIRTHRGSVAPQGSVTNGQPVRADDANSTRASLPATGSPQADNRTTLSFERVRTAKLGRDERGNPAWILPGADGKSILVETCSSNEYVRTATLYATREVTFDPFAAASSQQLPTTPSQAEMWRASQPERLGPEANCANNESFSVYLKGTVDDRALIAALQTLPVLHPALRAHFADEGRLFVIDPSIELPIVQHDLTKVVADCRGTELQRICASEASSCYHLDRGPLARATIITLSDNERVILLGAHRSACDGWSLDVILEDLGRVYSAMVGGSALAPTPKHSIKDYVEFRGKSEFAGKVAASRNYWRNVFTTLPPPLELAPNPRHPTLRTLGAVHAHRSISRSLLDSIRAFARSNGISLYSVVLTALGALIRRQSNASDFVIGVPIAGHPDALMEDAVGYLASVVPLRLKVDASQTFVEFCRSTNLSLLDARENAAVAFSDVLADLNVPQDPSRVPLVAVACSHMHKYTPEQLAFSGCSTEYELNARSFETYEVSLNVIEAADGLDLLAHANSELYTRQWLDDRLEDLVGLLSLVCSAPGATVNQVVTVPRAQLPSADTSPTAPARVSGSSGEQGRIESLPPVYCTSEAAQASAPQRSVPTSSEVVVENPIIVTLQRGRPERVPLICLFGIQLYIDLAQAIDDGTPVIGIHVPMLYSPSRTQRPPLTEVARYYLEAIRKVRPSGPYRLAGLCFGGIVAYEVAHLLQQQGEDIQLVVLLDSVLPHGRHIDNAKRIAALAKHPSRAMKKSTDWVKNALATVVSGTSGKKDNSDSDADKVIDLPVGTPDAVTDVTKFAATKPFVDTHLIAFRATRSNLPDWQVIHPDMGWLGFARTVQFCDIPSDHMAIVRPPFCRQVAQVVMRELSRV